MRLPLSLTACFLASTAFAEDITVRADIAAATIYTQGAELTRRATVTLPAGQHRLILPMRDATNLEVFDIQGPDGIALGLPRLLRRTPLDEGALDTPEEAAARMAVTHAEDALRTAQATLALQDARIAAIQAQLTYLASLARGGEAGTRMPDDPTILTGILTTLGTETARIGADLQAAREARQPLETAVDSARTALDQARQAFAILRPFGATSDAIAVDIDVPAATEARFSVTYPSQDAGWEPSYRLNLDSDTGGLEIERFIAMSYRGTAAFRNVDVRFSTENPTRQSAPSPTAPSPAWVWDPQPRQAIRESLGSIADDGIPRAEPAPSPALMVEGPAAVLETDGLALSYAYGRPVTLGPEGTATLPFDSLFVAMDLENRAVPRYDSTAFLVAMGSNTTGEPLLPGSARLYRDGALIGDSYLPLLSQGAEMELAFGALDHLRLHWQDISRDEGDRGVFETVNEQRRVITFGIENTAATGDSVRLIYATPFSEQEDLEIDTRLSVQPDARNIDDLRGVHAWDIALAPGETVDIEMTVDLEWPEDQILNWQP